VLWNVWYVTKWFLKPSSLSFWHVENIVAAAVGSIKLPNYLCCQTAPSNSHILSGAALAATCEYYLNQSTQCDTCMQDMTHRQLLNHKCPETLVQCIYCTFELKQNELVHHQDTTCTLFVRQCATCSSEHAIVSQCPTQVAHHKWHHCDEWLPTDEMQLHLAGYHRCPNVGCDAIVSKQHVCNFSLVNCTQCGKPHLESERRYHSLFCCEQRIVRCEACGLELRKCNLREHHKRACRLYVVQCKQKGVCCAYQHQRCSFDWHHICPQDESSIRPKVGAKVDWFAGRVWKLARVMKVCDDGDVVFSTKLGSVFVYNEFMIQTSLVGYSIVWRHGMFKNRNIVYQNHDATVFKCNPWGTFEITCLPISQTPFACTSRNMIAVMGFTSLQCFKVGDLFLRSGTTLKIHAVTAFHVVLVPIYHSRMYKLILSYNDCCFQLLPVNIQ
jgi:hypothetical protein